MISGEKKSKQYAVTAVLLACAMLAGLWVFVWQQVDYEKQKTLEEAIHDTMNLAMVFEENVNSLMMHADYEMSTMKWAYEKEGLGSSAINAVLDHTRKDTSRVQAGIANEKGRFIASSIEEAIGPDYSDREWFARAREALTDSLLISQTVKSRATGKSAIPLSRRVNNPDGSFAGVVHLSLDTDYFENILKKLQLGPGGVITLAGKDGVTRLRLAENVRESGQDIRSGETWKNAQNKPFGTIVTRGAVDGVERIFSYRVMQNYPLYIVVGKSTESVLAGFEKRKTYYGIAAAALSFVIAVLCFLMIDRNRKQRAEAIRLQRNTEIQMVLKEIAEATVSAHSMDALYATVHRQIGRVLPAKNLYFSLLDEAAGHIVRPYCIDETNTVPSKRPLDKGLTEYFMRQGRAVHVSPAIYHDLKQSGEITLYLEAVCECIGAPLIDSGGKVFGAINLFVSASNEHFREEDTNVLSIIAAQVSSAIERKRAEEELRKREAHFRTIIHSMHFGILIIDAQNHIIMEANQKALEMIGGTNEAILGRLCHSFVCPAEVGKCPVTDLGQTVDSSERLLLTINGEKAEILKSVTRAVLEGREVLIESFADITDRKRAEAALIETKLQRASEIQRDARFAARVQNALLPVPKISEYVDVATVYEPFGYVGGDLYFFDWRHEASLLRGFLVDAVGHGLSTALHTASLHVMLREVNERDLPLTEAVRWLNRRVSEYFDDTTFAGAVAFELDLQTRQLRWVSAGIPKLWVAKKMQVEVVSSPGMCLGIHADEHYKLQTVPVDVGDSFYFMTDGLADKVGTNAELPLRRFSKMVDLLKTLAKDGNLRDDATAVCIHVRALPQPLVLQCGWPRILRLNGYGDYQRFKGEIANILAEMTGKPHSLQEVALNEALANAMECRDGVARQHKARVKFNKVGNRIILRVKTTRIGFAGNAILRRLRSQPEELFSFGEDAAMGRGIPMMLSMSQKMAYNSEGTEVMLVWKK